MDISLLGPLLHHPQQYLTDKRRFNKLSKIKAKSRESCSEPVLAQIKWQIIRLISHYNEPVLGGTGLSCDGTTILSRQ